MHSVDLVLITLNERRHLCLFSRGTDNGKSSIYGLDRIHPREYFTESLELNFELVYVINPRDVNVFRYALYNQGNAQVGPGVEDT